MATSIGLLLVAVAIPSVISAMGLFGAIHADGFASQEVLFLNSTKHSHTLLVDGRLTVDVKDHDQHRKDLERIKELFPDPDERQEVLQWGRRLFDTCRDQYLIVFEWAEEQRRKEPEKPIDWGVSARGGKLIFEGFDSGRYVIMYAKKLSALREMNVSDELAAHCAWRRLLACPGTKAGDLCRLEEIVAEAVPDCDQRDALIRWAKKRRRQLHTVRQVKAVPEQANGTRFEVRPPAPNTDWFDLWILYQDWCVTDAVFVKRNELLLKTLGPQHAIFDTWDALLQVGETANAQRTGEHALPQMGERTLVIAAVDRLSGLDPSHSPRLASFAQRILPRDEVVGAGREGWRRLAPVWDIAKESRSRRAMPTEDYYIGLKGAQWSSNVPPPYQIEHLAREAAIDSTAITRNATVWMFPFTLVLLWLAQYGVRFLTIVVVGFLLGLRKNPQWISIRHTENRFQYLNLALTGVVILISWALTLYTLSPLNILFCSDVWLVLYAVLNATMIGGIFMEAIKNLCTMGVVRLGFDAEKVWIDELVAAIVTVAILLHFETSWIGIIAAIAIALVSPWTTKKIGSLFRREKVRMQWTANSATRACGFL